MNNIKYYDLQYKILIIKLYSSVIIKSGFGFKVKFEFYKK